jgi:hypothetical protein
MLHNKSRNHCIGVAKVGASSYFIGAIIKIDVVLFALVATI